MNQTSKKSNVIAFGKHDNLTNTIDGQAAHFAPSQNGGNVLHSVSSTEIHETHIAGQLQGLQSNVNETNSLTPYNKVLIQVNLQKEIVDMEEAGLNKKQIMARLRTAYPSDYKSTRKSWENRQNKAKSQGVYVGECFKDFVAFLKCRGFKPYQNHSIDRIDNQLGYMLGNVRWLDKSGQASNRGNAGNVRQYREVTGCSKATAYRRLCNKPEDVYNAIAPTDNESDPDKSQLWSESRLLINIWNRELQAQYPETGAPAAPTEKVLGSISALIKRNRYLDLQSLIPLVIQHWEVMQLKCKVMYGWYLGTTPAIFNFLSHPDEIINITRNIENEQAKRIQQQTEWDQKEQVRMALEQKQELEARQREKEKKEHAYSLMDEYKRLDEIAHYAITNNTIDSNQAIDGLTAFCTSVEITEEEFMVYYDNYRREVKQALRGA
jgi:hypothetical protein